MTVVRHFVSAVIYKPVANLIRECGGPVGSLPGDVFPIVHVYDVPRVIPA